MVTSLDRFLSPEDTAGGVSLTTPRPPCLPLTLPVCGDAGQQLELRMQPGYDHSYDFIQTVIGDHIRHHAEQVIAVK